MKNINDSELAINKIFATRGKEKEFWKQLLYEINSDKANNEIISVIIYNLKIKNDLNLAIYIFDFIIDYGSEKIVNSITKEIVLKQIENILEDNSNPKNDMKNIIFFLLEKWHQKLEKKEDFQDFNVFYEKYKRNTINATWEPVSYRKYILLEDLINKSILIENINFQNINYYPNLSDKINILEKNDNIKETHSDKTTSINSNIKRDSRLSDENNISKENKDMNNIKISIINNHESVNENDIKMKNINNINEKIDNNNNNNDNNGGSKLPFSVYNYENKNNNNESKLPFSVYNYENKNNNNENKLPF